MEQVVEPLKKEINAIRKELARLRRAVEKANRCPLPIMLMLALCCMNCAGPKMSRGTHASPPVPDPVVRDRLVPVYLSPDSALLTALFEVTAQVGSLCGR